MDCDRLVLHRQHRHDVYHGHWRALLWQTLHWYLQWILHDIFPALHPGNWSRQVPRIPRQQLPILHRTGEHQH